MSGPCTLTSNITFLYDKTVNFNLRFVTEMLQNWHFHKLLENYEIVKNRWRQNGHFRQKSVNFEGIDISKTTAVCMELTHLFWLLVISALSALFDKEVGKTAKRSLFDWTHLLEYSVFLSKSDYFTHFVNKHGFVIKHGNVAKDTGIFCTRISRSWLHLANLANLAILLNRIDVCWKQWEPVCHF